MLWDLWCWRSFRLDPSDHKIMRATWNNLTLHRYQGLVFSPWWIFLPSLSRNISNWQDLYWCQLWLECSLGCCNDTKTRYVCPIHAKNIECCSLNTGDWTRNWPDSQSLSGDPLLSFGQKILNISKQCLQQIVISVSQTPPHIICRGLSSYLSHSLSDYWLFQCFNKW